jgi:hypothetical protein
VGSVSLIDMLKEAVLRTGCLNAVTSVAGSSSLKPEVLAERLMLAIFGYGTNTGIRAVASDGHPHSEDDIRYIRRRYLTPQIAIANGSPRTRWRRCGRCRGAVALAGWFFWGRLGAVVVSDGAL